MSQNICFIAFGTFGSPNGFKQTFFIGGTAELAKSIKTFDLKTDAIKLFPKCKIYSIRKESANSYKAISYSIYTYAKEQNSDRGGTFAGSGILYLDKIAEESNTIACLNEFHDTLISKNVQNDVISVNHSDKFVVSKPSSYYKLESGTRDIEEINFAQSSGKSLVVYSEVSAAMLQVLFKKSLDLLNVYDAIYFTSGKEVAEFVHQKNLFQLVQADGFEQEILKLHEERKQHVLSLVAGYESEKQKLEEDKQRLLGEWKEQINTNEKIHQKNKVSLDELKQEYSNLTQTYEGFEKSINHAIAQLQTGKKPDRVRQLYIENKKIFIDSINEYKLPAFINTLQKPTAKTDIKPGFQQETSSSSSVRFESRRQHRKQRLDRFKIASLVLLVLWLGTLFYFLFYTHTENTLIDIAQPKIQVPANIPKIPEPVVQKLNPKPNSNLSGTAFLTVMKSMKPHASADDVVNIIFTNNPEAIKKVYAFQKEDYKQYLIEQNTELFEKKDSSFYLKSDTLTIIPSYQPQR